MHSLTTTIAAAVLAAAAFSSSASGQAKKPALDTPSAPRQQAKPKPQPFPAEQVEAGENLFTQHCAFCHGRDAGGGETGPDLTRSKLVGDDVNGDKIGPVVRNGRVEKGMPRFSLSDPDIASLVAFVHTQKVKADSQQGGRRGVDVEDLQTGNVEAGKRYFEGAGGCTSCHSATGNLAGVAKRYAGLKLEERLLYPEHAKEEATVTLPSGETIHGELVYRDEFTLGVRDPSGWYHSWPTKQVNFSISAPAEAHVALLSKYTDDDIHNLMAYLQTLQ